MKKIISSKKIQLIGLENCHLRLLYEWRNCNDFVNNCTHRPIVSFENFVTELNNDFESDRHLQYIIQLADGTPIGTVYSYSYNKNDNYLFITTFLSEKYQSRGYGVGAFYLFSKSLFDELGLYKIYCDIYEYNKNSLSLFQKLNISLEGRFLNQKRVNENRFDVLRYAIYGKDLDALSKYARFLC